MKGGKRPGAGRKPKPDKKQQYATRLRPDQIKFLKGLNNAAKMLESIIDSAMLSIMSDGGHF